MRRNLVWLVGLLVVALAASLAPLLGSAAQATAPSAVAATPVDQAALDYTAVTTAKDPKATYLALPFERQKATSAYARKQMSFTVEPTTARRVATTKEDVLRAQTDGVSAAAAASIPCWISGARVNALAGSWMKTAWVNVKWCNLNGVHKAVYILDKGGSVHWPGWRSVGQLGPMAYHNAGWEIRVRYTHRFMFGWGPASYQDDVCVQFRGGRDGNRRSMRSCDLYFS